MLTSHIKIKFFFYIKKYTFSGDLIPPPRRYAYNLKEKKCSISISSYIDNSLVYKSATFQLIRWNERRSFEHSSTVKCTFVSSSSLIFAMSLWYPLIIAMDRRSHAIDRHDSYEFSHNILFAVSWQFIGTCLVVISSFVNHEISWPRVRKRK